MTDAAGRRVDRFILAARTLGDQAARIFAIDALIDYAAEQTRAAIAERDRQWRDAWSACGHFREMTTCDPGCRLKALLEEGNK